MIILKKITSLPIMAITLCLVSVFTTVPAQAANKSIMTNFTREGSPDATLKQALDTLYYGSAKDASKYYITDVPNFKNELKKTQAVFIKTVERVTIRDVYYSNNGNKAAAIGEIKLKGVAKPTTVMYKFRKKRKEWKIVQ